MLSSSLKSRLFNGSIGSIESLNNDGIVMSSINQCIIQMEIVDAVSNILFGRDAFKVEGPSKKLLSNSIIKPSNSSDLKILVINLQKKN